MNQKLFLKGGEGEKEMLLVVPEQWSQKPTTQICEGLNTKFNPCPIKQLYWPRHCHGNSNRSLHA